MKAYSVAMLQGTQRDYVSYGGKIILPPSALANLTNLDLESPWNFQLRNPSNPAASTNAGVLEFIAQEGVVHLPYWMMKALRLNEGDPVRITGTRLPKGKFVKLQAQSTTFLEISDPKAVRYNEIVYNSIVFELLIMEIKPDGPGINVVDTDLEVDFAPPKGYVEPKRPEPAPPETMASKLKIDVNSSTPGSSRPGSSLSNRRLNTSHAQGPSGSGSGTIAGTEWESFKGAGQTLNGRKTKGKGKSARKIEDVDPDSKIYRTDKPRFASNDVVDQNKNVPAPLRLPRGKLFFGFPVVPYPTDDGTNGESATGPARAPSSPDQPSFSGSGNTLSGRAPRAAPSSSSAHQSSRSASSTSQKKSNGPGSGQTLSGKRRAEPEIIEIDSD
ncbi:ubiquitin fusion degradation protein UFD1-domain-containing protein [Cantharellus anzutake]|uniref:ubiquitin fusion degradation protein UFD1-domain-containing protein n=1 Tax=Cantharellus anzutake TaxID=1750568 RepID=UPI0019045B54|nr:ubiquitin fusion degradation protein UFD1-domain-containing protein [Cantharellus anzutake]KAF8343994.1 ubiquitin fusion degradation protein UFD1-domain-containing protein [Cantharellus anzutake]